MSVLLLPKNLYFRSLNGSLQSLIDPVSKIDAIDLGQLDWVHPSGMAGLAALTLYLKKTNELQWLNAATSKAFRYLQDMDFFNEFSIFPDEDFERQLENKAFARLVRVDWDSDSTKIARNLAKLFQDHASPIYNDLFTCVEESIRNVIDHATQSGYAVAQAQPAKGGERSYKIAICDSGRGIKDVLADDEEYRGLDDRSALEVACKKGTSSKKNRLGPTGDPINFGLGLYQIDRIAETTSGEFILCSGRAARIRDANGVRYEQILPWQGTSVEITLYLSGFRRILSKPIKTGRVRFG